MICPFLSRDKDVNCREKDCAVWMELFERDAKGEIVKDEQGNPKKDGKCSLVWQPILQIELMTKLIKK